MLVDGSDGGTGGAGTHGETIWQLCDFFKLV